VLTTPQGRFSESGFLGLRYKPFATGGDPSKTPFAVEGITAEGRTPEQQKQRAELGVELDTLSEHLAGNVQIAEYKKSGEEAQRILSEAEKVFKIEDETPETRDRYGRNRFGQSCLVARRLVESGVKYVTINYNGWDTHKEHFQSMNRMLPELDKGVSSLLNDLSERGLLDTTIVWVGGEFGRTPKIDNQPPWNGGRSHYAKAFSHLVAGGGFKGGTVVGKTDDKGENVVERPVYPWDLLASMYILLGIDPNATFPDTGEDVRHIIEVTDKMQSGGILREIMPQNLVVGD